MQRGTVVAGRFEIERAAGAGGMAKVYRALDRSTGSPVAVKVLLGHGVEEAERLSREAEALAHLDHPAIVRYVAHGALPEGDPFLVIEWLEGESLSERIRRKGLTVAECLALGARVADALDAAHRAGVVHRDVKPSNLYLVGGRIDGLKVLDFGLAKRAGQAYLTQTGVAVGTPRYMAPEQARGERGVGPPADVFALGSVLFTCLTGQFAFDGEDALGVLLKLVLEQAPRASSVRPDLPEPIDALVARMLSRTPAERPTAAAASEALRGLAAVDPDLEAPPSARPPQLTASEQGFACLVIARARGGAPADRLEVLRDAVLRGGATLDVLADGSLLVGVAGAGVVTDHAIRAAGAALAIRARLPEAPVAIVAGRVLRSERLPVREVIDRGMELLGAPGGPRVRLDEVIAGLLGARFEVDRDGAGAFLRGPRGASEAPRTLLGRPAPFVGRDRELVTLEAVFEECVAERVARAVVVKAPPGVGKSRLVQEFVRRLRARAEPVEVWIGRGDPMSAGSPFGILSQALSQALGLSDADPPTARKAAVRARVALHVPPEQRARVAEFLGEIVGLRARDEGPSSTRAGESFPALDAPSLEIHAARRDVMLLGDQMRRAWEEFVAAETGACPVVLVLEDLHWGDLPTVMFADAALRGGEGRPLMVLAIGRPELDRVFPRLWAGRVVTEFALGELSRRASEQLVRGVLGAAVGADEIARLAERAGGNAFFLEELIRASAEGRGGELPETVVAMVQTRLDGLDAEARRALRAASVFGQVFWRGAVIELLGGAGREAELDALLATLAQRELFTRRPTARFAGESEYVFRHALLREAAYATLTEEDRAVGHRLAGRWLERVCERDGAVLAEHFERAGERGRLLVWARRAAEQALEGNDFCAAVSWAERGLASGATGKAIGVLCLIQAEAHRWRGEMEPAAHTAGRALAHLPAGSSRYCLAAAELGVAASKLGRVPLLREAAEDLLAAEPLPAPERRAWLIAMGRVSAASYMAGEGRLGDRLLARVSHLPAEPEIRDPAASAWIAYARSWQASMVGDNAACLRIEQAVAAAFERIGDRRFACHIRSDVGYEWMRLGMYAEAERVLRASIATADRLGLLHITALTKHNLGLTLAYRGLLDEARRLQREAIAAVREQGDRRGEAGCHVYLALTLTVAGELEEAEREARLGVEMSAMAPPVRAKALATLGQVLLLRERTAEALAVAAEAARVLEELGGVEEGDALIRLVHAEARRAAGERGGARLAIAAARERLLGRAERIADPALRASFLENVPEHARTLALASRWDE